MRINQESRYVGGGRSNGKKKTQGEGLSCRGGGGGPDRKFKMKGTFRPSCEDKGGGRGPGIFFGKPGVGVKEL